MTSEAEVSYVEQFINRLKQTMPYNNPDAERLLEILDQYKYGPLNINNSKILFYVYTNNNDGIVSFYIDRTAEQQTASNIQHHINNASAYIDIVTDLDNRSAVLRFISVNEEDEDPSNSLRGKGVGSFLILYAITYLKLIGIDMITLDDDSDNFRQSNNIYVKLGCKYDDEDGPEMTCDINEMIHQWSAYKNRYETAALGIKPNTIYGYTLRRKQRFTKKPYQNQNGGKLKRKVKSSKKHRRTRQHKKRIN